MELRNKPVLMQMCAAQWGKCGLLDAIRTTGSPLERLTLTPLQSLKQIPG